MKAEGFSEPDVTRSADALNDVFFPKHLHDLLIGKTNVEVATKVVPSRRYVTLSRVTERPTVSIHVIQVDEYL